MKLIYIFKQGTWLGLCFLSLLATGQSRRVDWIHGVGGSAASWQDVANSTGRQITGGTRNSYVTGNGIPAFANDVAGRTGGANTIAITHSLGGPAARHVDLGNPNQWSGIITAGSPLRGAQIATSTRNGVGQDFVARGTVELMRGPSAGSMTAEIIGTISCVANVFTAGRVPCLPLGILLRTFGRLGTLYAADIAALLVREISAELSLTDLTAPDLNPQGAYMQGMIGQGTGTPKINIWGEETNPVFWRVCGTFIDLDDEDGRHLGDDVAGLYHTLADVEYATSWIPPFIFRHGYYNHRGHEWMAGANWARNTANPGWQHVIGAASFQNQLVQMLHYDLACGEAIHDTPCPSNTPNCPTDAHCYSWVWQEMPVYTVEPSDGVVVATSQRNDGGAWRGHIVRAGGLNHMEYLIWNNKMQPVLTNVFNGDDTGNQDIFRIAQ
jgi:pimeloyl-ACP methyl ester carboxylesterase